MQILFLPAGWTVLLCFVLWPIFQFTAAYLCHHFPDKVFSKEFWLFNTYAFEKEGKLYDEVFHVRKWKHLLPDGSIAPRKQRYRKKHLKDFSEEGLEKFLLESRRAELTHWLSVPFFWVFGLIAPAQIIWYMLIYAIAVNLPCILVQRYNRPRIAKLQESQRRKKEGKIEGSE